MVTLKMIATKLKIKQAKDAKAKAAAESAAAAIATDGSVGLNGSIGFAASASAAKVYAGEDANAAEA